MYFSTPKNFKNGKYIMNRFRKKDLLIFLVGLLITVILFYFAIILIAIKKWNPFILVPTLIPAGVVSVLILIPTTIKHNFLENLKINIDYQKRRKILKWEGVIHFERQEKTEGNQIETEI